MLISEERGCVPVNHARAWRLAIAVTSLFHTLNLVNFTSVSNKADNNHMKMRVFSLPHYYDNTEIKVI